MVDGSFQLPSVIRNAGNLPSLPSVVIEVLRLSRDPDATIDDLVEAISADPAISVKLLKLANSSHYRRGKEVTNVAQASIALGMKTVQLLTLSFSLAKSLPRDGEINNFDIRHYWKRSLTMAVAARATARLIKTPYDNEAFLAGLLARIGQLIMATTMGDEYSLVLAQSETSLPASSVERDVLGYDFHQVGESLLVSWNLPRLLSKTVGCWNGEHALSEEADNGTRTLCRILEISDSISMLICEAGKGRVLKQIHELALRYFGLTDEEIDKAIVTLQDEVSETASALDVDVSNTGEYESIVDDARQQMLQISLETVVDLDHAESRIDELVAASNTDRLTGIANRTHLHWKLEDAMEARLKGDYQNALGVLVMDIDHFRSINETYGHVVGDEVLKTVASWLTEVTQEPGFIARYGGQKFVVILPDTTIPDLESMAERFRRRLEVGVIDGQGKALSVTISVGGACAARVNSTEDAESLMESANQCLQDAKNAGRNQCVCRNVQLLPA